MSLLNRRFQVLSLVVLLSIIAFGFSEAEASYQVYKVKVVNEFPHDPKAYTQGLLYAENDTLFESTGLYGRSTVRKVALGNGKVEAAHKMQSSDFGEGLTLLGESALSSSLPYNNNSIPNVFPQLVGSGEGGMYVDLSPYLERDRDVVSDRSSVQVAAFLHERNGNYCSLYVQFSYPTWTRLFQLTWLQDTGFIYDRYNLSKFEKFTHHMQDGWGFATDGGVLFGSDGTSTLYEIDPQTMKVIRKRVVKSQGHEVPYLNELEYVKNEIWANVYVTDCIARISPKDGTVIGWILLQSLREDLISRGYKDLEVLNGIAWDRDGDRIFVTGKLWPKLFEIKLLPLPPNAPLIGEINNLCIPKPFFLGELES